MATTELEVANLALGMMNVPPLTSLADPNRQAQLVSSLFADARDELLREHAWNFAHRIDALDEDTGIDAVPYGFSFAYELPTDCLRVHKVCMESDFSKGYRFSILQVVTGGPPAAPALRLFADIEDAYARYTIRTDNVALWDQLFVRAMASYLAFRLAVLKGIPELQANMFSMYQNALAVAKSVDAGEQFTMQSEDTNPYVSERD